MPTLCAASTMPWQKTFPSNHWCRWQPGALGSMGTSCWQGTARRLSPFRWTKRKCWHCWKRCCSPTCPCQPLEDMPSQPS
uniref:Alternative protein AP1G2 n=1 Tax=Homo sapiens TaxID=9606 RepID=L8EA67_HUMAN|nr:alternative protein AP1G2 [Homo sapiens]